MSRAALTVLLLALPAAAQTDPESEWSTLPSEAKPQPPRAPAATVGADGAPASKPSLSGVTAPRPVLEPNTISMFGGRSLGFLNRGQMLYLGFALLGIRLSLGVTEYFDVGLGFDSFYGMMNEPLVSLRANFFRGANWSMAATLEAGWAFFIHRASVDLRGARWLTGRRNGDLRPGIVFSYQGNHPRAARLFLALQYMLSFDTEPYQRDPLGGVPSKVILGHNGLLRAGAEMPLSTKTSFVFLLGIDVHGRSDDVPVMPVCSVGLVTSI